MKRLWWSVALLAPLWLAACGGDVSVAPEAPYVMIPGGPGAAEPEPDPDPDPGAAPGAQPTLTRQVWTSVDASGPQRRVVVQDSGSFVGWWREDPDSGPPTFGVFSGTLQPPVDGGPFSDSDMKIGHLPSGQRRFGSLFSMSSPVGDRVEVALTENSFTLRADAVAHQDLSMDQRSGHYAGELVLPGRRDPVSLHWGTDGGITLSFTQLAANDCQGSGQALPLVGAPARVLEIELRFSGAGCPDLSSGEPLTNLTMKAHIDTESADAFVLFGSDTVANRPLLLQARRVPTVALQGAWSGLVNGSQTAVHMAVLEDLSILGWFFDPNLGGGGPAHGLMLGSLPPPAPGATSFGGGQLQSWIPSIVTVTLPNPGFTGPLPVSESMLATVGAPATLHAVPIAHQALPMSARSGSYSGNLHLPLLTVPASVAWAADGQLSLSLSGFPACALGGQARALEGGPARWLSFELSFSGSGCPVVLGGQVNLSGVTVRGAIDAASGDEFVLFGLNDNRQVSMVLAATRTP